MSAYVLSLVTPIDAKQFTIYREIAQESMKAHGGKYIIRGGTTEVAEGEWPANQLIVMMEFPDMTTLHKWYDSSEYAPARAISSTALTRQLIFVEGMPASL